MSARKRILIQNDDDNDDHNNNNHGKNYNMKKDETEYSDLLTLEGYSESDICRSNVLKNNSFTIIELRNKNKPFKSSADKDTTTQPGMCDKFLSRPGEVIRNLDRLIEIADKRKSERTTPEVLFCRETLSKDMMKKPMNSPILPKQSSREFLLVSYDGLGSYLQDVWDQHRDENPSKNYHRLAVFHEILISDRHPFKLYIDMEYKPEGVPKAFLKGLNDESRLYYSNVKTEMKKKIELVIKKLNTFWNEVFTVQFSTLKDAHIRYIVFDASRGSGIGESSSSSSGWKLSFHLVWFVEGVRFIDQDSIELFLNSALEYETKLTNQENGDEMQIDSDQPGCSSITMINGQEIIDFSPYSGRYFRAPFNTKLTCNENGVLCPPLLPVCQFMDDKSKLLLVESSSLSKFCLDLFYLGLIHYIPKSTRNIDSSPGQNQLVAKRQISGNTGRKHASQLTEDVIFFISSPNAKSKRKRIGMKNFRLGLVKSYVNDEITSLIRPISKFDQMKNFDQSENVDFETLSIPEIADEVEKEFAFVISLICMLRTKQQYGICKITLEALGQHKIGDYELFFYRCSVPSKRKRDSHATSNPCLCRFYDNFRPHNHNNNYVILNIHSMKWHMACHDFGCIRNYLVRSGIDDSSFSDTQIKNEMIKARSETFAISEETPKFLYLVSTLSIKIRQFELARMEFEARTKKRQIDEEYIAPNIETQVVDIDEKIINQRVLTDKLIDSVIDFDFDDD